MPSDMVCKRRERCPKRGEVKMWCWGVGAFRHQNCNSPSVLAEFSSNPSFTQLIRYNVGSSMKICDSKLCGLIIISRCIKLPWNTLPALQLCLSDTGGVKQPEKGAFPVGLYPPFRHLTGFPAGSHRHRDIYSRLTAQLVLDEDQNCRGRNEISSPRGSSCSTARRQKCQRYFLQQMPWWSCHVNAEGSSFQAWPDIQGAAANAIGS